MYKRFAIVSIIIMICLFGFSLLGYYSIGLHAEGLAGRRMAEFASVAEQIRIDVKRKIDAFITQEENRSYTQYQYYYVPIASNDLNALVRSPLGDTLEHGLAYGHFQIEPDGSVLTPYIDETQKKQANVEAVAYVENVRANLLTVLKGNGYVGTAIIKSDLSNITDKSLDTFNTAVREVKRNKRLDYSQEIQQQSSAKGLDKSKSYNLRNNPGSRQTRYENPTISNFIDNRAISQEAEANQQQLRGMPGMGMPGMPDTGSSRSRGNVSQKAEIQVAANGSLQQQKYYQSVEAQQQSETVQVRIEPFMTVLIADNGVGDSLFDGQVFMLRHIRIEGEHFLQGFRFNEQVFMAEIKESASRLMRRAMSFDVSDQVDDNAVHAAILDSDFGEIVLNLFELEPAWIGRQVGQLRTLYLIIIVIVLVVIAMAQGSLLKNIRSQITLARKKDDFISAVSHELRTPLTSIRMYTEMLENNWIKSEDKRTEYYRSMRQESERLSRLVENVLDFSRIQRGSKKYNFTVGNIDECIAQVVEMMRPAAQQAGFIIEQDLGLKTGPSTAFDKDAVSQIVINLIDNAIKYAANADEKIIFIRTVCDGKYVTIEVEDHGPGIANRQRSKVFDAFYRIADEATRETTGTGLGLALVSKFAQAHNGFVEILSAKPSGAILRVALAVKI